MGLGALALAGGLGQRQEHSFEERPEPVGKDFAITSRMRWQDRTVTDEKPRGLLP